MYELTLILRVAVTFDCGILVFSGDSVVVAPTCYPNPTFADCDVYTVTVG